MPALKVSEPGSESTPAPPRPTGNPFPLSSRLATSSSPRLPATDSSDFEAHASISAARALAVSNLELLTLRLEWVERLCEPGAPLKDLKEAAKILDSRSHMELIEERHSLELCPYPPCKRKAGVPYAPEEEQSFKVSLRSNALCAVGGKNAFCSKLCEARSEWWGGILGTSRTELLEDVEERRRAISSSIPPSASPPPSTLPTPPLPASPLNPDLTSLSIHERPTPSTAPAAPTPSLSFERPLTTSSSTPSLSRTRPARSPLSSGSALLPFDGAGISKTLLQASRTLGVGRREEEEEGEEELGWKEEESEEVRGWMEEALESSAGVAGVAGVKTSSGACSFPSVHKKDSVRMASLPSPHQSLPTPLPPAASLPTLPTELKLHIVKLVRQGSEGPSNLAFTAIRALALVNKEFAVMAQPEIWKTVDLRYRTPSKLVEFAAEFVPRHADFITSLLLADAGELDFLSHDVSLAGDTARSTLSEGVNNACRLLAGVMPSLLSRVELAFNDSGVKGSLAQAVVSVAERIVDLEVYEMGWTSIKSLSQFPATFSALRHLEIDLGLYEFEDSLEVFTETLGSLANLESLVVRGMVDPFLDAFAAQAHWSTSLTKLEIYSTDPMHFDGPMEPRLLDSILTFLAHLAPTLTSFSTDRPFPSSGDLSTLHLHHMHTLHLASCPDMTYKTLHDLLVKHRGTLKDLTAQVDRPKFGEVEGVVSIEGGGRSARRHLFLAGRSSSLISLDPLDSHHMAISTEPSSAQTTFLTSLSERCDDVPFSALHLSASHPARM